jgi:ABC-2 type transport system permease protein
MMATLLGKLFRDVRLALLLTALLLAGYQTLWAKITESISSELLPTLRDALPSVPPEEIEKVIFGGPRKLLKTLLGGEGISIFRVKDTWTIGYIHPLTQVILCVWALGRAAGAIAGEIDRGTMELLLAQPIPRYRLVLAHLCMDAITIPLLCLSLIAGNFLGSWLVGLREMGPPSDELGPLLNPTMFLPALANVAAFVFALSGFTMWLSSRGRFRGRVLGTAVFILLVQFLINVVGQLWPKVAPLRPFTVFYYYQPQQIILHKLWSVNLGTVWNGVAIQLNVIAVLVTVGVTGYALAWWTFCRRDLPAPL